MLCPIQSRLKLEKRVVKCHIFCMNCRTDGYQQTLNCASTVKKCIILHTNNKSIGFLAA